MARDDARIKNGRKIEGMKRKTDLFVLAKVSRKAGRVAAARQGYRVKPVDIFKARTDLKIGKGGHLLP